jgi:hypothetical protein
LPPMGISQPLRVAPVFGEEAMSGSYRATGEVATRTGGSGFMGSESLKAFKGSNVQGVRVLESVLFHGVRVLESVLFHGVRVLESVQGIKRSRGQSP